MAGTPEGKVKEAVKRYLKTVGAWYYMPVSNGMGRVGCPDFLVCIHGLFVAIETKAPGKVGNVTPNQVREIDAIKSAHGLAVVVDSVNQVKELFDAEILAPRVSDKEKVQRPPRRDGEASGAKPSPPPRHREW